MKFYTDIDYVLHNYNYSFIEALKHFKSVSPDRIDYSTHKRLKYSLQPYAEEYGLDSEEIMEMVFWANKVEKWKPFDFSKHLAKFLKKKLDEGHEVIAVTARESRSGGEAITTSALGREIPVITCDTQHKHLVIDPDSIYFEDHPEAVENIDPEDNILVFMPSWPWNVDIMDGNIDNHFHTFRLEHDEFKDIDKFVESNIEVQNEIAKSR